MSISAGENNGFESEWGSEGSGPGEFRRPTAIAVDKDGNVLVADNGNRRIQKFDANGRFLDAWGIETDDSDKLAAGSGSEFQGLRIFVDETGTISLTSWSWEGWSGPVVRRLDPQVGLRPDIPIKWRLVFGFVYPEGNVYIRQEEGTSGANEILRFSTDGDMTGRWGSCFVDMPELAYPMDYPLFSDINGDIYSLFPYSGMVSGFPDFGHFGTRLSSLHGRVQDSALLMHLPTSKCHGRITGWGDDAWRSSLANLFSLDGTELCGHRPVEDIITIGRSPDNTIVVDDSTVSRHHARIEFSDGAYFVEDLGSRNGTKVDNSWVTRVRLASQSSIKVGKETINFFYPAWAPRLWQILSETAPEFVSDRDPFFHVPPFPTYGSRDINPLILKFSPECELIDSWAPKLRDPHLTTGSFAVNVAGNVFFSCGECNEVTELSPDGDLITRWGEKGTGPGQFDGPMGIAAGPTDEIYLADTRNHRIQKFRSPNKGG